MWSQCIPDHGLGDLITIHPQCVHFFILLLYLLYAVRCCTAAGFKEKSFPQLLQDQMNTHRKTDRQQQPWPFVKHNAANNIACSWWSSSELYRKWSLFCRLPTVYQNTEETERRLWREDSIFSGSTFKAIITHWWQFGEQHVTIYKHIYYTVIIQRNQSCVKEKQA